MPIPPEGRARENIDRLLSEAGWIVQSRNETNTAVPFSLSTARKHTRITERHRTICNRM